MSGVILKIDVQVPNALEVLDVNCFDSHVYALSRMCAFVLGRNRRLSSMASMFVPNPLVWYLGLLPGADDWDGLAVNESLVVPGNQYPAGMQSLASSNLIADLL